MNNNTVILAPHSYVVVHRKQPDIYDVYEIEYYSGWKFKSTVGLFKDYIDKWNSKKNKIAKEV